MPELIWKGKEQVINHHLEVPVRVLDQHYTFNGDAGSTNSTANTIIHGDNLEALKALLPEYEGRIRCIYIDPPYNTGNESWVYNDNVNDPQLVKWLGQVVGKDGEDLCRHDKWLCMMYPRLQLLRRLLAEDGSIWISIDDNEQAHLRAVMNEIFGSNNFVASVVWQKRTSPDARIHLGPAHDYVLVYGKTKNQIFNKLILSEEQAKKFKNPDNDPRGPWASADFTAQGWRPNQMYKLKTPAGIEYEPPAGRCWVNIESEFLRLVAEDRIWFGKNGKARPRVKNFLTEVEGFSSWTWWSNTEAGHNQEAKKEVNLIVGGGNGFDTPKPTRLIQRLLQIATRPGDIILDSFAGSGTTGHAVLNLNRQDGGTRTFILIEMMAYAETITAERIKRVINGYGEGSKAVAGTGGGFTYCTLGERVFDDDGFLNPNLDPGAIRDYVARSEGLAGAEAGDHPHWLGERDRTGYYFYYDPARPTVLNLEFLATLTRRNESYLIYADSCLLDELFMQHHHILFKKIPRDISRF